MKIATTRLRSGEQLTIKMVEPPLNEYADQVGCWTDLRDDLLGGRLTSWLFAPYFVGEISGKVVASMSYFTPTDTRDVGVTEFVRTDEKHRQKGIASALLARMHERFTSEGGLALYLCTDNPIAGKLYEKHGYWYHVGDGLRYLAPDAQDFDRTYLDFCGEARIRDATWADLPRTSVLYNHSEPKWLVKDYLSKTFRYMRYESHFVKLLRRIESRRGAYVVLENPRKRVVGAAALERLDTFFEQHVATLGFRVVPGYFGQVTELLDAAARKAQELSIRTLQTHVADSDDDQKELVQGAGFVEESRLKDRLRVQGGWVDMLIYTRSLPGDALPLRNEGDYYGGRNRWQAERVASSHHPSR